MMMPDGVSDQATTLQSSRSYQSPPLPSHIMTHPELADTFEAIAKNGRQGFYTGRIAEGAVSSLHLQKIG